MAVERTDIETLGQFAAALKEEDGTFYEAYQSDPVGTVDGTSLSSTVKAALKSQATAEVTDPAELTTIMQFLTALENDRAFRAAYNDDSEGLIDSTGLPGGKKTLLKSGDDQQLAAAIRNDPAEQPKDKPQVIEVHRYIHV